MTPATLTGLLLVPALLAPGAVKDRVEILERDVRDLRQEFLDMRSEQTDILLQLEKLNHRLGEGGEVADLATAVEQVGRDVQSLFERLNDDEVRMERMEERLRVILRSFYQGPPPEVAPGQVPGGGEEGTAAAAGGPPAGEAGTPEGVETGEASELTGGPRPATELPVDPEELYQTAYSDFARGNYELAILGFQDYLERYPVSEFADNAQYWVGEANYSMERYPVALEAFQMVLEQYPEGDKVPDSMLKKGYTLFEMNRIVEGIRELQALIRRYPDSTPARMARQRLESMGLAVP
jgi:tol-pal system protein YbgF